MIPSATNLPPATSGSWLRAIFDAAPEGIVVLAPDGRIVDTNASACHSLGYGYSELTSLTVFELDESATPASLARVCAALESQRTYGFETRYRCRDGRLIPIEGTVIRPDVTRDELVVFARDISTRRARDRQIEALKSQFETFFDRSPIAHIIQSNEWITLHVNQALCDLFGFSRDEMVGRDPRALGVITESNAGEIRLQLESQPHSEPSTIAKYRRKDGRFIHCEIATRVFVESDGKPTYLSVLQDRTAQIEAERNLKHALAIQSAIVETSAAGVIHFRAGEILMTSATLDAMLGYAPGELVGQDARNLYTVDDVDAHVAEAIAVTATGQRWKKELQLKRRDGTLIWCAIDGARIDPSEPSLGGVYTVTDISAYREQQAKLERVVREQQRMFDNSVVGIAFLKDDVLMRCNRHLEILLASDPGALIGRRSIDFYVEPAQHAAWLGEGRAHMLTGKAYTLEVLMRRLDGHERYIRLQGAYIDPAHPAEGLILAAYDVDQERHTQVALRESEARFQAFGRSIDQEIYISNITERRLEYINDVASDLWGVSASDLQQGDAKLLELIHPDDREIFLTHSKRVANHEAARAEFRVCHATKGIRWLSNRVFPSVSATGNKLVFGLTEDVTEFKNAEEALRRAMAAQRAVADAIGAGIVFLRDDTILDCNRYYADLVGLPRERLAGAKIRDVYADETEYERALVSYRETLDQPERQYERAFTRPDGRRIQLLIVDRALSPDAPEQGRVVVVLDITEQRRQADALEHALAQQQLIFESLSVGVAILRHHKVTQCNVQYAELLGYEPSEIVGMDTSEFYVDARDFERHSQQLAAELPSGEIVAAEGWAKRKDGSRRRVIAYGRALNPASAMDAVLSVVVDISDRFDADTALTAARLEIDAAYEGTSVGLAYSKGGVLVRCNRRFEELLGYSRGELTGLVGSRAFFVSDEQFEKISVDVKRALADTGYYESEQETRRKDGSRTWVLITVRLLDQANPELGRVLSLSDVSQLRAQRQELSRALAQLQLVFEGLAVGVARTRERVFIETNATFDAMFGFDRYELVGQPTRVIAASDEDYAAMVERVNQAFDTGRLVAGVRRYRRKDGADLWCLVAAQPLNSEDASEGLISVFYDVTEMQLQQAQLQNALLEQKAIFDSSATGLVFTRDRKIERINRRLLDIAGISEAELIGRDTRLVYDGEEDFADGIRQLVAASQTGQVLVREKQLSLGDGRSIWVSLSSVFVDPAQPALGVVTSVTDISERKRQEAALKQVLLEQELVIEGMQVGTAAIHDRVIQRCNSQFGRIFGYEPHALVGESTRCLYASDAAFIDAGERILAALDAGNTFNADLEYLHKLGHRIICQNVVKAIDMGDPSLGVVSAVQDVTEEREQRRAMVEMRNFLDEVIESLPLSLVVKSATDLSVITINKAAENFFGIKRADIIGRPATAVRGDALQAAATARDWQALAERRPIRFESTDFYPNSMRSRTLDSVTVPVAGEDGAPLYALTIGQDVTEQRAQQAALNESEARFRKFAEVVDEVIFVTSVEADHVYYLSDRFADVWGGDPELVRADPEKFLSTLDADGRRKLMLALKRAQRLRSGEAEIRVEHPQKGTRWIRVKTMPTRLDDGQVRLFGVAEDITERRASTEKRLDEQREQLEILVREVHHRIKNNLQGVAGLIQQKAFARADIAEFLHEVAGQIQAIAQVHGLQVRSTNVLTLRGLVRAIVDNLQRITAASYQIDVGRPDLESIDLPEHEAVPVALVINELVTNAVKHREDDRAPVEVRFSRDQQTAVVSIFSMSRLPPGFALENVPYGASGLGLVKALLPRRGARLTLASKGLGVEARLELSAPAIKIQEMAAD